MRNKLILIAFSAFFILSSCSSVKYHTTRVQHQDFTQYKTYGWLPPVDSLSKNYLNNDIAKVNILTAANKAIAQKGLTYSKENPDILFRYITIVNNKSRLVYQHQNHMMWGGPWGWYRPWGFYGGYSYPVGKEKYRYAHLIIEAVDRQSNTVIWQARASDEIKVPEKLINKLPTLVEGIFKEYPVK